MTFSRPTDDQENRVRGVIDDLIGVETPDDIMENLIGVLSEGSKIPTAGNYYTFFYSAKTSGTQYDEHPLVAVTDVFSWGFKGINFHWGESRQYTFQEIVGGLYNIEDEEIDDARNLSFGKFRLNR